MNLPSIFLVLVKVCAGVPAQGFFLGFRRADMDNSSLIASRGVDLHYTYTLCRKCLWIRKDNFLTIFRLEVCRSISLRLDTPLPTCY